jgi:DNA-binding Lrp family transcriptional regulator
MNDKIKSNTHIASESSGFENIGKFYKYIRQKEFKHLNNNHRSIYMLMIEYSFGYVNNIQYEISLSHNKICEELNISKPTSIKIINELIELKLISRIEWQNYGPKQAYKYKVNFPKGFNIKHKETQKDIEINTKQLEIDKIKNMTDEEFNKYPSHYRNKVEKYRRADTEQLTAEEEFNMLL